MNNLPISIQSLVAALYVVGSCLFVYLLYLIGKMYLIWAATFPFEIFIIFVLGPAVFVYAYRNIKKETMKVNIEVGKKKEDTTEE